MTIEDRTSLSAPVCYVVFTDRFLSGWGKAGNLASYYILACSSYSEARTVLANGNRRSDMMRGRIVAKGYRPNPNYCGHAAIVDKVEASRWYDVNGF